MNKRILINLLLLCTLVLGISSALAQQYDTCDPKNPNYCSECRDESKRDFEKCSEIDYRNVNLPATGRVVAGQFGLSMPDLDPYTNKAVFVGNLTTEEGHKRDAGRFEIFVADAPSGENQKRVTWSSGDNIVNAEPFWTKDRKIEYAQTNRKTKKAKFFLINEDGSDNKEISRSVFNKLGKESHDENMKFIIPLPE